MPRDAAKVRRRLQAAALELYQERGFDATTTGDIAARAGVTERTFFRHFPDKKDVLFDGQETLRDLLTAGVRAAPVDAAPLDVLLQALLGIVPLIEANRPIAAPRAEIIRATPALRERAGAKTAWLSAAVSAELQQRGVPAPLADLAVDVSMAAFQRAAAQWFEDPAQDVRSCVERTFGDLRVLAAALPQGLLPARPGWRYDRRSSPSCSPPCQDSRPGRPSSVARPCPRPRPWTQQRYALQRDKVTHAGTEKKRPPARDIAASGAFPQRVAGDGFEPS